MAEIRDATPADYALYAELFPELRVPDATPSREHYEADLMPTSFVLEDGDRTVAFAYLQPLDGTGYVRQVIVHPDHRRRGHGRALLREAVRRFAAAGCTTWCLNVHPANTAAVALYRSEGMRLAHESVAVRIPWAHVTTLPAARGETREPDVAEAAAIEAAVGLPRGLVVQSIEHPARVVQTVCEAGEARGVACFDPAFPGCFPFRAASPAHLRALLEALRPHARAGDDEIQLVLEDSPALVAALERAGARRVFEFVHFRGPLPPPAWRGDALLRDPAFRPGLPDGLWDALARGEHAAHEPWLATLRRSLEHGPGAVLLRGLPIGDPDATRASFLALGHALGTPVSQSAAGELCFAVQDEGYQPGDPRFRGPSSSQRLRFHTDRCDVIAFLCVRPAAEGGETLVVSSRALYETLRDDDPATLAVLEQPFPYLRHTVDRGNPLPYCLLPVFSHHEGHFAAHLLRVLIDRADRAPQAPDLSQAQRDALDALDARAEDPTMHARLTLAPGDVLLLNNWTTFHRRSAFSDHSEPERRRLLLRIWLSMPDSRPIAPAFAHHFAATAAGAIRGGMRPVADEAKR